MSLSHQISHLPALIIRQRKELAELIGFETRNKYEINAPDGRVLGFAAEQQNGFLGALMRQFLGHWRTFEVYIFDADRKPFLVAKHPFRFLFKRLEVADADSGRPIGALQQRFSVIYKRFDVASPDGRVLMRVSSPIWRIWTFRFQAIDGRDRAVITKKWSGALKEIFTDSDNFALEFTDPSLGDDERKLLLASAIFIDLIYFEQKA
jgi:uncharacterized protein YxjI